MYINVNERAENKKAILKKIIDIKFDVTEADDRVMIDEDTVFEFLELLSDMTIAQIRSDLEEMY